MEEITTETTHSRKYEKVKDYYDKGLWTEKQVKDAVAKEWVTAGEYKDITGREYGGDSED